PGRQALVQVLSGRSGGRGQEGRRGSGAGEPASVGRQRSQKQNAQATLGTERPLCVLSSKPPFGGWLFDSFLRFVAGNPQRAQEPAIIRAEIELALRREQAGRSRNLRGAPAGVPIQKTHDRFQRYSPLV